MRTLAAVSEWIANAAGNDPFLIMLLLVVLFIIVGDFIDAIPAIIIFMPIITDLTKNADINPVHMGVVIIVTLAFGLIMPPYGLCLLMAAKIRESRLWQSHGCIPANLHHLLRRNRFLYLPPGRRALAAEAVASGIRWLLQESKWRRRQISIKTNPFGKTGPARIDQDFKKLFNPR